MELRTFLGAKPERVEFDDEGNMLTETGPLLAGWQSNRFLNPVRDGAVLPILHLGGYRVSGPSVLGRMVCVGGLRRMPTPRA